MTDVLAIARAHYEASKAAPLGRYTVTEWKDGSKPVSLVIKRLSASDYSDIEGERKRHGDHGLIAMTLIRSCYSSDDENKRVFADTDIKTLMAEVDFSVLKKIYEYIQSVKPAGAN